MRGVICNIPHSGLIIPEWSLNDYLVSESILLEFANRMVDKDIDRMFSFVSEDNKVVSNVSRIVVDMERYRDDRDEPMSKLGMGLFYTKTDKGEVIREKGRTYEECLKLYDRYHLELLKKVEKNLKENNSCCVLDCHSFHNDLTYTGFNSDEFPDVCIGFNEETPSEDVLWIKELFNRNGYSVAFNMPFAGSLVPLKYLEDRRVSSIMLELNRRIYDVSEKEFLRVQSLCKEVYHYLESEEE